MTKALLFVCAAACVFSCKKSNSNPDLPYLSPVPVLVAAFEISGQPPYDTVKRTYYSYDALQRPLSVTQYFTTNTGDTSVYHHFKYVYSGNERFAALGIVSSASHDAGNTVYYKDTTAFTFSNGKMIYDSSYALLAAGPASVATRYTHSQGVLRASSNIYYTGSPMNIFKRVTYSTYTGDNITYQLDSTQSGTGLYANYRRVENTVSYLSNPNPFAVFADPIRRPYLQGEYGLQAEYAAPKHLFASLTTRYDTWGNTNDHFQSTVTFDYVFRPDGYPSQARMLSGGVEVWKVLLKYQ